MSTLAGTIQGRYEILGVVGRGNMGAVYKARDPRIDRLVAIKTISLVGQEATDEREYRERLFQEARAAGRLSHAGIVTIFDVGEEPESHDPFIVMEYVAGQSLDQYLERFPGKKMLPGRALELVQEISEALDYAHRQGVIHRDIKPTNILITEEGHAKIADFGIAKLNQSRLTMPGQVFGSPAYMAPEQIEGEDADGRADLFSLGVILYSILTGHRPFQGNSTATVAFKVVHRLPLPVTALEADLPKELDAVVSRAIAKDPAERYQTGVEFAQELKELRRNFNPIETDDASQGHTAANPGFVASQLAPRKKKLTNWRAKINAKVAWGILLAVAVAILGLYIAKPFWGKNSRPTGPVAAEAAIPVPISSDPQSLPTTTAKTTVPLLVEVEHHFSAAQIFIKLDGKQIYAHALKGARVKHALVFRETKGSQIQHLRVEAGEHALSVRMKASSPSFDQTKLLAGNFVAGKTSSLHVNCDGHQLKISLR